MILKDNDQQGKTDPKAQIKEIKAKLDETDIARAALKETKLEEKNNDKRVQEQIGPPGADLTATVKEIEKALFEIKFYPVAVNEESKNAAVERLTKIYNGGDETIRQLVIYMVHESLAHSAELRVMHNFDFFKMKNPAQDPAQLRINVYRAIFNYNTSIEGLCELIRLLGQLRGSDDAAKLLTYHFAYLSTMENEANHMLRAAIIDALGKSESRYALKALLEYAHYSDSDRTFSRVVSALAVWDKKMDKVKIPQKEKEALRNRLQEVMTRELGSGHYG